MTNTGKRSGFSLIEVNMAILVIAIGMLSLMSLFPLGLRESSLSQGDMLQAAGADYILGRVQSEARQIVLFAEWRNPAQTRARLAGGLAFAGVGTLNDYPGPGNKTRYRLRITPQGTPPRSYRVAVQLTERPSGDFSNNIWFYTEVVYHGNP